MARRQNINTRRSAQQQAQQQARPQTAAAKRNRRNKNQAVDPTTGLTKRGMIEVTPQDQIRPRAQQDITDALGQGKQFGALLGEPGSSFKTIGGQGSALGSFLDRNKALAEQASQFSGREEQSISEMEKGLQGYNSQEVQAMREAANAETDRNLKTAQYQQAIQQARSGVSGGAAMAGAQDLALAGLEAKRGTERDLVVQNAQEALARKQAFANAVNAAEAARWGRTGALEGQYGQFLSGTEQFNANQATNEALARAGLTLEGAGIYTGQLNSAEANRLAQQGYNAQNYLNRLGLKYANKQSNAMLQNNLAVAGIGADAAITAAGITAQGMQQQSAPPATAPAQTDQTTTPAQTGKPAGGKEKPRMASSVTGEVFPQDTTQGQKLQGQQGTGLVGGFRPLSSSSQMNRAIGFRQTASAPGTYGTKREEERRMY